MRGGVVNVIRSDSRERDAAVVIGALYGEIPNFQQKNAPKPREKKWYIPRTVVVR
jgi:hypothetical protein